MTIEMDKGTTKRLQLLFLDNPEEPKHPQFSDLAPEPVVRTASPISIFNTLTSHSAKPTLVRSASNASTRSSASSQSNRYSSSRQNSISSSISTTSIPPWHLQLPTFDQQLAMTPHNYGYDLPCEFACLGCEVRFDPPFFESWISHSASHFVNASLPPKAICTFCDDDNAVFSDWRDRMIHIGGHLQNFDQYEDMRPDFWVIEHMWNNGLISPEDYMNATKHSERPHLEHMVPLEFHPLPTLEEERREERQSQEPYNLHKERREMKRRKGKGKDGPKTTRKFV